MSWEKILESQDWLDSNANYRLRHLLVRVRNMSLNNDGGALWKEFEQFILEIPPNERIPKLNEMHAAICTTLSKIEQYQPQPVNLGDGLIFIPTLWGYPLIGFANDLQITKELLMKGYWELPFTQFLQKRIKPGMRILEIGANIGYFSVMLAFLVGFNGRVEAYEPNPSTASVLRRNLRMNNVLHVVKTHELALADSSGTAAFYTYVDNQGGSSLATIPKDLLQLWNEEPKKIKVKICSLDAQFADEDEVFDFVKLDAEGSEARIFEGGTWFFEKCLSPECLVYLEYNPVALRDAGSDPESFLDRLETMGFKFHLLQDGGHLERLINPRKLPQNIITDLIMERNLG